MLGIWKRVAIALALTWVAAMAAAQSEYKVRSGDTLIIEVLEDSSLNRSVVVLPDGRFSFPFVGTLAAKGRTVGQIQAVLRDKLAPNFASAPNVFVSVQPEKRVRTSSVAASPVTIDVYFLGEVNTPGLREVKPGTTFLQAMAQAGGLTRFAATKRIQLRRTDKRTGQQTIQSFNYKALSEGAEMIRDPELKDGDVILVPERRLFE